MYLENVDLREWQTQRDIKAQLARKGIEVNDLRAFRKEVTENNRKWCSGQSGFYVCHSNSKGYKAATAIDEIDRSIADLEKRSYAMLISARKARRALGFVGQGAYNNLAEIRKNRELSQNGLVKLMREKDPSFDAPTLSRIETGKVLPNVETLSQLAEVLGCETWEIIAPQYLM